MRADLSYEEWPEGDETLVYLRRGGRAELVVTNPQTGRVLVVPVSLAQARRLAVDATALLDWLYQKE